MATGSSSNSDSKALDRILKRYTAQNSHVLIHLLQDIQNHFNYLPPNAIKAAAYHLNVPLTKAYSVASFYKAFSLTPRGKTILKVCMGTSCHIRGAENVVDDIRGGLGIGPGETSSDMEYTLEVVNCVGACALAPVVIVDNRYLANVKPGTIVSRIEKAKDIA